jgi:hypothetical protein
MKSGFTTHREKQIFICDYSNFGSDSAALISEMTAAEAFIISQPENSLLVLMDARNSVASTDVVKAIKNGSSKTRTHISRLAIIGVTGVRKIILDAVTRVSGQEATLFDDPEKAKDWLAG